MRLQQAIELLESLPEHLQAEGAHFVEFLAHKQTAEAKAEPASLS